MCIFLCGDRPIAHSPHVQDKPKNVMGPRRGGLPSQIRCIYKKQWGFISAAPSKSTQQLQRLLDSLRFDPIGSRHAGGFINALKNQDDTNHSIRDVMGDDGLYITNSTNVPRTQKATLWKSQGSRLPVNMIYKWQAFHMFNLPMVQDYQQEWRVNQRGMVGMILDFR